MSNAWQTGRERNSILPTGNSMEREMLHAVQRRLGCKKGFVRPDMRNG